MDTLLVIAGGVLIGCFLTLSWFAGSDAPYVPTKMEVIKKILKLAGIKKGKKFYDLGSGDGRIVLIAARLKAESVGIEQSILRILMSRFKSYKQKLKNAKFSHGNMFSKNYSDADIVYIYLLPKGVKKIEEKLKKELKKGAIVITNTYHFPSWKSFKKIGEFNFYKR